ncbi:response regulator [Cytobacillus sp. Hz8]|uniref:response regulator n=1 Tax=Cytobacillus sp. Hz8 TaxID=3347168 RepID=UPI0035DCB709
MKKILIVDDSLMMRHKLREIVEKEGYKVVAEASDGEEAIQKYKMTNPDLVIMDITMPEMNGIQALLELKKIDENVKVIMVSAMGQKPMVIDAIKYGAKDFLVKPFETEKFISSINKVIA